MSEPKRYHLYAGLECQAFTKAEAVLKFSEEDDGIWVKWEDYARLKAEVERLTERLGGVRLIVTEEMYDELNTKYLEQQHELQNIALTARQILDEKIDLKEQVERLTKAVMHSPAAQLKLKELEGKTTFDEINPDNQ